MMIDYSCHFTSRTIVEPTESSLLFGTKCKAIDLYCIFHASTVIWNDKIIHTCPFNHITDTWLESEENVLNNQQKFFLFEPKEKVNFCNTELINTRRYLPPKIKPLVEPDTDHKYEGVLANLQL